MEHDKDIRISQKKVDESWKDQIEKDRQRLAPGAVSPASAKASRPEPATSQVFLSFINSLAYQVLYHLGEIPEAQGGEVNLDAAREMIDILVTLQSKTQGNLSTQEAAAFKTLIPELQLKFTQHA